MSRSNAVFCFNFSLAITDNKNQSIISCFFSLKVKVLVAQSCPILCDPMDCSPPGSSVHGILQARTLEWIAIPFSRRSSQPRDQTQVSCIDRRILYHLSHQERQFPDAYSQLTSQELDPTLTSISILYL